MVFSATQLENKDPMPAVRTYTFTWMGTKPPFSIQVPSQGPSRVSVMPQSNLYKETIWLFRQSIEATGCLSSRNLRWHFMYSSLFASAASSAAATSFGSGFASSGHSTSWIVLP